MLALQSSISRHALLIRAGSVLTTTAFFLLFQNDIGALDFDLLRREPLDTAQMHISSRIRPYLPLLVLAFSIFSSI